MTAADAEQVRLIQEYLATYAPEPKKAHEPRAQQPIAVICRKGWWGVPKPLALVRLGKVA